MPSSPSKYAAQFELKEEVVEEREGMGKGKGREHAQFVSRHLSRGRRKLSAFSLVTSCYI